MFDAATSSIDGADPGRASARAGVGLHQLRYVLAAAEHGGFRRAARQLGVQQSAVSRRISELEARLGAQIFERGPHGVQLTETGRDFVLGAQGAVSDLDETVDRVVEAARGDQRCLRIGLLQGHGGGPLHELLRKLLRRDSELKVDLVEGDAAVLCAGLTAGRLDLAFLVAPPAQLVTYPAWRERLLVALTPDDALATAALVQWSDLAGRRLLVPTSLAPEVEGLVGRRLTRRPPDLIVQAATPTSIARLVALDQGYAILNEGGAGRVSGVIYRPLARSFIALHAVLGRRPEKPSVRRLVALLVGQVETQQTPGSGCSRFAAP